MDILIFVLALYFYFNDKRAISWVGFLILTTNYLGYGLNESRLILRHNVSDIGLLFSVIVFLFEISKGRFNCSNKIKTPMFMVFCFLGIAAIIDLNFNHTSYIDVIKTGKAWLVLLTLFPLSRLNFNEVNKIIKLIVGITIFQCVLYYIQYFSGIEIYEQAHIVYSFKDQSIARGGFPPTFAFFVWLYVFSDLSKQQFKLKYRVIIAALVIGTVILSITRSELLAFAVGAFFMIFMRKPNIKAFATISVCIILGAFLIFFNSIFSQRIESGLNDIKFAWEKDYRVVEPNETFSYRMFFLRERLDYLARTPYKLLFGLGFIHETSLKIQLFVIVEEANDGSIVQLDTGDIAWAILLIRLGIIGTIIYLFFYFQLSRLFFVNRHLCIVSEIGFTYLIINLCVFSFAGINIATPYFWPFVFILFYYQENCKDILKVIFLQNESEYFSVNNNPIV